MTSGCNTTWDTLPSFSQHFRCEFPPSPPVYPCSFRNRLRGENGRSSGDQHDFELVVIRSTKNRCRSPHARQTAFTSSRQVSHGPLQACAREPISHLRRGTWVLRQQSFKDSEQTSPSAITFTRPSRYETHWDTTAITKSPHCHFGLRIRRLIAHWPPYRVR